MKMKAKMRIFIIEFIDPLLKFTAMGLSLTCIVAGLETEDIPTLILGCCNCLLICFMIANTYWEEDRDE